ncbi:hypothetical protein Cgig2_006235 [Carnegiea gigantea]|uniref:Uncharacterized protein n=1 Tax=Carnegiea gigantea TaxID=171969 RepID=A0A9Q1JT80_9CARY|nr:hypothetical protein Cgig2_006235 [Carnegiea gigantea]
MKRTLEASETLPLPLSSRAWSYVPIVGGGRALRLELQASTTWFPGGARPALAAVFLSLALCSTVALASMLRRCSSNTKVLDLVTEVLLADKKITKAQDLVYVREDAIKANYPAEDIEQEPLATFIVNKLKGTLRIAAMKAPGYGDRRHQYMDDIAVFTGAIVIRDEVGLSLDRVGREVPGHDAKIVLTKENATIVGDGSTQEAIAKKIAQIKRA